jgi:hypothetical protein
MAKGRKIVEQNQAIVHEWMIENGSTVNLDAVAKWAVGTGRWQRPQKTQEQICKDELAKALRSERHVDPQGRHVRTMHSIKIEGEDKPLWEWEDIRTARPERIRTAFSQRRQGILADVLRHKDDVDSYNENNTHNAQLPLFDYNFNLDIEEGNLPTEYNEDEADLDDIEDVAKVN